MNKFFFFFIFLYGLHTHAVMFHELQIDSIKDALHHIPQEGLLLLDIDKTLLKKDGSCCEGKDTLSFFENCKKRTLRMIALTARGAASRKIEGDCPDTYKRVYQSIMNKTVEDLQAANLHFRPEPFDAAFDQDITVVLRKGMKPTEGVKGSGGKFIYDPVCATLFTDGHEKGVPLFDLLKKIHPDIWPHTIVLVDDRKENLISLKIVFGEDARLFDIYLKVWGNRYLTGKAQVTPADKELLQKMKHHVQKIILIHYKR